MVIWVLAAALLISGSWSGPFVTWVTTTYTFTDRRFIQRTGFIAREGRTIPLNRISGVDFEIGLIDRIFGCGTLVVTDASEQGPCRSTTSRGSSRSRGSWPRSCTASRRADARTMGPEASPTGSRDGLERAILGEDSCSTRPRSPPRPA